MSGRVMVVDDSLTVRMDLADAFVAAGWPTATCADLAEARQLIAGEPPALIVLDLLLPDGDGLDLLRELRAAPPTRDVVVLLLSSEAEVRDRIRGVESGADDYVGKPYDVAHVVQRARELLAARTPAPRGTPRRVLVIDDSATYRELLREVLEQAGYRVHTARSGEEGLRVAGSVRPDAVIVDGMMPGIDGLTVIRRMRTDAALRDIPCLLITAADEREYELRALDSGADGFVNKDGRLDVLLARLAAILRGSETGRRAAASVSSARVVLVEPDAARRARLKVALGEEGYDLVEADSGEEALALLLAQRVDCVLLSDQLPALSGHDTCRRIRADARTRELPLVVLGTSQDRAALLESFFAGADDFVQGSGELDVLKARVRAQIRRKHVEDEHRRLREALLRRELEAAEARAARELAELRAAAADELARKNRELEAFSYSVSHDLGAPLRSIDGFAAALAEEVGDSLGAVARSHLARVRAGAQRMKELIEDLLYLSRVGRGELRVSPFDLGEVASEIFAELTRREPGRVVHGRFASDARVNADRGLVKVLLENLIGNAWKFTARKPSATIELGMLAEQPPVFFVRDDGAGFDMKHASHLFQPFKRLHADTDFAGSGIGLATVHRVVDRHGGRVWAQAEPDKGATIYFTLPGARQI